MAKRLCRSRIEGQSVRQHSQSTEIGSPQRLGCVGDQAGWAGLQDGFGHLLVYVRQCEMGLLQAQ